MKYMHVCSVQHGADNDLIDCGIAKRTLHKGDFVVLENGVRGIVMEVAYIDVEGSDFALLADFTDVNEVVSIYYCAWRKEESLND